MALSRSRSLAFLPVLASLFSSGCGGDSPGQHDSADAGDDDRRLPDGAIATRPHDGAADGGTSNAIDGSRPAPLDSAIVTLTSDGALPTSGDAQAPAGSCGACASGELCDPVSNRCVDGDRPWQLDCAKLPGNGVCQGGPRAVLLATTNQGDVYMLDPNDGHYLGLLKQGTGPDGYVEEGYQQATQGPDQCIWTVSGEDTDLSTRAVERWNTDGSFRDAIIPRHKFDRDGVDRLQHSRALAFGPDYVLVASGDADYDTAQISRYRLDGSFESELTRADVRSLLVLNDGSLLSGGSSVQHWPAGGGAPSTVLSESSEQLWYLGQGELLTPESSYSDLYSVSIEKGTASQISVVAADDSVLGVAALGNGRWLYTSSKEGALFTVDPKNPSAPRGDAVLSFKGDLRREAPTFTQLGRACLPNEGVDRVPVVDPAVTAEHCTDRPAGTPIVSEDFETGMFSGSGLERAYDSWKETTLLPPPADLVSDEHVSGARSLRLYPKTDQYEVSGVARTFSGIKPSYIGFWVKLDTANDGYAELMLSGTRGTLEGVFLNSQGVATEQANVGGIVEPGQWQRVQLRDFDWSARTYDLYVNCRRIADDLPLKPEAGDDLRKIDLFVGFTDTNTNPAYFDDLVIL